MAETNYKPRDIPEHPEEVYAGEGWAGFEDWLKESPLASAQQSKDEPPAPGVANDGKDGAGTTTLPDEDAVKPAAGVAAKRWLMKGSGDLRITDLVSHTGPRFRHHPHALRKVSPAVCFVVSSAHTIWRPTCNAMP